MSTATFELTFLNQIAADPFSRDNVIQTLRENLKLRSTQKWSVTGGEGTAWGWINITARRKNAVMSLEERTELGKLFGLPGPVHPQGLAIPASTDYRREYLDRVKGLKPIKTATQYWD